MSKKIITTEDGDETGRWYDPEDCQHWKEAMDWDDSNQYSLATGSQWDWETLYLTRNGAWIVWASSGRDGCQDSHRQIEPEEAAAWLIRCNHALPDVLMDVASKMEA